MNNDWKTFVLDHDLKHIEDWISVWMFRHNQTKKLCFAITSRRMPVTSSSHPRNDIKRSFFKLNAERDGRIHTHTHIRICI